MQATPLEQQQLNVAAAPTFWHHVRFEVVRRHARARGARTVLDIGAGAGLLGDHLRSSTIGYRFAESSPSLRDALAARFGSEAVDDGTTIDPLTLVALLDVIEHVDDDAALLLDLFGRMAPGAGLVVTVPAMGWLFSSWDRDLGHRRRYSRRAARRVVKEAGFDVIEASYLFPELVPIAALRRFRSSDGTAAEFPSLPRMIDRVGRWVGTITAWARRAWPFGTSVIVVATRPGTDS